MKMRVWVAIILMSFMTCGNAGAWGIPKIPGIGGGGSSVDPDAFLAKAKASEVLVNTSAAQLCKLVSSKEEQAKVEELQKKIEATTDPKEKNALMAEKTSSELAAIGKASADKQLEEAAKQWDSEKKSLAAKALFNLALGGKMAADLVPQGQNMATAVKSNPLMLAKVASIYEAVKCLGGIGTGTAKILTALPPVFSAANIEVKLPTSSAETPEKVDL